MDESLKSKTVTLYDYGCNVALAKRLSREFGRVLYFRPWQDSRPKSTKKAVGDGIEGIERVTNFFDPKVLHATDLFIFPDVYCGDLQRDLISRGKRVFGSCLAEDFEFKRELFLKTVKQVGLPVAPYKVCIGTTALKKHMLEQEDFWVKVEMRGDDETWHHQSWSLSQRKFESMEYEYGGIKECIRFVCCQSIPTTQEIAYDGYFITSPDGKPQFPDIGFLGYEDKNLSHILTAIPYDDFPDEAREVNDRFAPKLAERWCRSPWGTEVKNADDGSNYFIDATPRMPEPPGSIIMEAVKNIGQFMWEGAEGNCVPLEIEKPFGVQIMLYSASALTNWLTVEVPPEIDRWVKLCNCCYTDDAYQIIPEAEMHPSTNGNEEIGAVVGLGDSIEEAIEHVKENCELVNGFDVTKQIESLMEGLKRIQEGEKQGIPFADDVPEPISVME